MMKKLLMPTLALTSALALALPAHSQEMDQETAATNNAEAAPAATASTSAGESRATLPRTRASIIRLIPAAGASSFALSNKVTLKNLDEGFTAGLFADFGPGWFAFETGVITNASNTATGDQSATVRINNWGIPLLAKFNFSGKPHETVFLKAGVMPFTSTGDVQDFDVMGVAGIGGAIPLGHNSSLIVDASYNRLFTTGGDLTDYQGIAFLGGLQFNL